MTDAILLLIVSIGFWYLMDKLFVRQDPPKPESKPEKKCACGLRGESCPGFCLWVFPQDEEEEEA